MLEPKNENETFFSREARATSVSGEARELKTSVAVFINDEDKDIFFCYWFSVSFVKRLNLW